MPSSRAASASSAKEAAIAVIALYKDKLFLDRGNFIIETHGIATNGEAAMLSGALSLLAGVDIKPTNLRFGQGKRLEFAGNEAILKELHAADLDPKSTSRDYRR